MMRAEFSLWGLLVLVGGMAACGSNESASTCSGNRDFALTAVDDDSRRALPGPIFALEKGGLTQPSPSPDGNYAFGGQGNTITGAWSLGLPCGLWGVHVFANGYRCESLQRGNVGTLEVGLTALEPNDVVPLIAEASWSDEAPRAGAQQTLTVTTTAASALPQDQVTAVVVVEDSTHRAVALTAVAPAEGSDGITQVWQGRVLLSGQPGMYIYSVVAATSDCLASKILRLPLSTSA